MPHRPFVHLAGNLSGWPRGFAPQPAHMRKLDQFSSELVDGETGGSWTPEEALVIGPFGTPTVTLGNSGSSLTGDVETVEGNDLGTELDTPGLILQSGAVPSLQSSRTRTVVVGFTSGFETCDFSTALSAETRTAIDPITLAPYQKYNPIASSSVSVVLPFRAQHRGATITQVDFRVRTAPSVLPSGMKFRVLKVTGNTASILHTAAGQYDADGWYTDPSSAANGQVRVISYVPNQNNTNIDSAASWYLVQAATSLGSYGALAISATVQLSAIADYRQE